jgi:hypothetical protein
MKKEISAPSPNFHTRGVVAPLLSSILSLIQCGFRNSDFGVRKFKRIESLKHLNVKLFLRNQNSALPIPHSEFDS